MTVAGLVGAPWRRVTEGGCNCRRRLLEKKHRGLLYRKEHYWSPHTAIVCSITAFNEVKQQMNEWLKLNKYGFGPVIIICSPQTSVSQQLALRCCKLATS